MKFGFWVSFSRFPVSFWEVFGVPGDTFCDFEGAGKRLEILWFLVIPWVPYELRQRGPGVVKGRLPGAQTHQFHIEPVTITIGLGLQTRTRD